MATGQVAKSVQSPNSSLSFDSVLARAAHSNLTVAQVSQRQRDMMSARIQGFGSAFSGSTQAPGPSQPAWLDGTGAQFEAPKSGLSGEQHKAHREKACFVYWRRSTTAVANAQQK